MVSYISENSRQCMQSFCWLVNKTDWNDTQNLIFHQYLYLPVLPRFHFLKFGPLNLRLNFLELCWQITFVSVNLKNVLNGPGKYFVYAFLEFLSEGQSLDGKTGIFQVIDFIRKLHMEKLNKIAATIELWGLAKQ